jgi:hypothetical protein
MRERVARQGGRQLGVVPVPLLAALAVACGGRAFSPGHESAQAGSNAQDASAMSPDAGGLANRSVSEAGSEGVSAPPLSISGVSLWLDGDMGVGVGASGIERWADRSGQGHIFLGQGTGDALQNQVRPQAGRLGGHGAVRFNTRNRMIIEQFPTARQQTGLTFGLESFLVAVVFQTESETPLGHGPTPLVMMRGPWFPFPPSPTLPLVPPTDSDPLDFLFTDGNLTAAAGVTQADLGKNYGPGLPHLVIVVVAGAGAAIEIRADGQPAGTVSHSQPTISPLDYRPIYIGDWDFDWLGFDGTVGELVVVKGATESATVAALENYLMAKYGL